MTNKVHKGDPFKKVPEVWVIFGTETDFAGGGKASLHYQFKAEDDEVLGDPAHVVVVNGDYKGTLEGRVIHDIMTRDPQEMQVPDIRQPFTYLKGIEKGQKDMTEALAQLVDQGEKRGKRIGERKTVERDARNMAAAGFSVDQIVGLTGASPDDVQKIMNDIGRRPGVALTVEKRSLAAVRRSAGRRYYCSASESMKRSSHAMAAR